MPIFEYEIAEGSCRVCGAPRFELLRSVQLPPLSSAGKRGINVNFDHFC